GLGVVMVASASLHLGERSGSSFHYVARHLLALGLGGAAALVIAQLPTRWWARIGTPLYFAGLAALALVLIPGLGKEVNGAVRWIAVGPFNLQTSEYMKLILVVYLAGYLVRRKAEVTHSFWAFLKPMGLLLLAAMLLMAQPDFGTAVVLLATALGMLFLGGAPLWQFTVLVASALAGLAALVVISPYRLERVTSFLNPWSDPFGSGYQLSQALIAFGRGEWFGVGLGNGIQKQFYLPEAHTDFLMAVVGEEFGLVGTLAVIALFGLIVWRAFAIGTAAEQRGAPFAGYVAYGLGLWLGMQALVNIGVNVGALPTKGLTLPFMSYGSNSLIVCVMALGMLYRIHLENRRGDPAEEDGPWLRA
ncbi:MAG: putative lipid II flippase FtsW, partial [Gammaproteobacteria bacterium]